MNKLIPLFNYLIYNLIDTSFALSHSLPMWESSFSFFCTLSFPFPIPLFSSGKYLRQAQMMNRLVLVADATLDGYKRVSSARIAAVRWRKMSNLKMLGVGSAASLWDPAVGAAAVIVAVDTVRCNQIETSPTLTRMSPRRGFDLDYCCYYSCMKTLL